VIDIYKAPVYGQQRTRRVYTGLPARWWEVWKNWGACPVHGPIRGGELTIDHEGEVEVRWIFRDGWTIWCVVRVVDGSLIYMEES